MKTNYFKVINRETKEERIFNSEELDTFFRAEYCKETNKINYKNRFIDYAISSLDDYDFLYKILFAVVTVAFVVLTSKFIMIWI